MFKFLEEWKLSLDANNDDNKELSFNSLDTNLIFLVLILVEISIIWKNTHYFLVCPNLLENPLNMLKFTKNWMKQKVIYWPKCKIPYIFLWRIILDNFHQFVYCLLHICIRIKGRDLATYHNTLNAVVQLALYIVAIKIA